MAKENTPENQIPAPLPQEEEVRHELTEEDLEERERQIARHVRFRRILIRIILVLIVLVALGIVIVWKVFTVEKVEIEGNRLHSKASIQKTILEGKYSWNSLYVYGRFRFGDHMDEFPYAESVEVQLASPHVIHVDVREKDVIGYFYSAASKKYVGFGDTGEVLLLSDEELDGYIRVTGLKPTKIELYRNMKLEDDSALTFIKSVTTILENYEMQPDVLYIQKNGNILLSYGDLQVNLGDSFYLNEKIVRMQQLLAKLEGRKGTLHLETWTESTTDVYFRKGELASIPK